MSSSTSNKQKATVYDPQTSLVHPEFLTLVDNLTRSVEAGQLAQLRRDFHTRLRISLSHPENNDLIKDLWDFFYDWCVFDQGYVDKLGKLSSEERQVWNHVKTESLRGLFEVSRLKENSLHVKDLFTGKKLTILMEDPIEGLGISKGDILESRLLRGETAPKAKEQTFRFLRRPSYHPYKVNSYIKKKVKQFEKSKDEASYQNWLWLVVGMSLKHRIYQHMPIEKIYDDNSRI